MDYYHKPDVLFSEDNEVPLYIVDGPIQDGTGYIYTVQIQSDDPQMFLNPIYLEEGRQFSKVWTSIQSEYNSVFGTQQYPNSFMLESQLGYFGQSIHVTDKALRQQGRLAVEFMYTDYAGKSQKVSTFMPMAEAKMWDELVYSSFVAKAA